MKRIEVTPGFCALLCVFAWQDGPLCLAFLISVLCHEAGHFFALKLCGVRISGVSFRLTGAMICTGPASYGRECLCASAGPAASLLVSGISLRFLPRFAVLNGLLAVVNLLPLYPLDGGRILRAALASRLSTEQMERVIRLVTYGTCGLLMLLACWLTAAKQAGIWPIFAALLILCRVGEANLTDR